ncbi:MAG: dTDP-4-dehydrorhamnose 3,5-epimerase [Rhodospirillales bacterium]|nr:dTDP-4-dehydrorhamnose 3,5-epimerase [Rhodospirillales bacterium]
MKVFSTDLAGVLVIEPNVFGDDRGYFFESYRLPRYRDAGIEDAFVQDNISYSQRGVLRGLHIQNPNPQGKLVFVLEGAVFDVAADVRAGSPTFGQWVGVELSSRDRHQIYVPPGFAHGFCVTSETALVCYKCTDVYNPEAEFSIQWNDPTLKINWPIDNPALSAKDSRALALSDIDPVQLVAYSSAGS